MAMTAGFFKGTLQDGIGLAVREAKAVVCFVRDDGQASSIWEEQYFNGESITPTLDTKAILLHLVAGSPDAGFLTSFCPIAKFPAVVVIKNGTLQEYLVPDISRNEFQSRLVDAVNNQGILGSVQKRERSVFAAQNSPVERPGSSSTSMSTPETPVMQHTCPPPKSANDTKSRAVKQPSEDKNGNQNTASLSLQSRKLASANSQSPEEKQEEQIPVQDPVHKITKKSISPNGNENIGTHRKDCGPKPHEPREGPAEFRLQVRLFDGSSVRSSFSSTQTICSDVRSWLDNKMGAEKRPYNLKHVLTPLPSRTLSVSEESQNLQDLGLGSTANLVMVPIPSYIDAYSSSSLSLPVRSISAVYNVVSSAITTATGLVGSLARYGMTGSTTGDAEPSTANGQSISPNITQPPSTSGPNIRTLRDQENTENKKQFYNGNQLNFEPQEDDKKDH